MSKKYTMSVSIFMHFFFLSLTLSFLPFLPDMDYMPRLFTASLLLVPSGILAYIITKAKTFILPKRLLLNVCTVSFLALVFIFFFSFKNSLIFADAMFDLLKLTVAFLLLVLMSLIFWELPNKLKILSESITVPLFIVLIVGLVQLNVLRLEAIKNNTEMQISYQLSSLLSNKNSLAEFILLSMPLSAYCCYAGSNFFKVVSFVNILLSVMMLFFIRSFSVSIALSICIICISFLVFKVKRKQIAAFFKLSIRRYTIFSALLLIIISVSVIYSINVADGFTKISLISKYLSGEEVLESFNENSVFERMLLWKNSLLMIKENFWTGIGLGNWKILFPAYGYTGANYLVTDSVKFTRAHNDFLQVFAETGFIGFAAFVLVLISAIVQSVKKYLSGGESFWLVMVSGILGYSIVAMFGFPTEKVFLVIMLITYLALITSNIPAGAASKKINVSRYALVLIVIPLALSFYSMKVCAARIKEEANFSQILALKEKGSWQRMYKQCKSVSIKYFPIDYTATPVAWYYATAAYMNGKNDEALASYKDALLQTPYHVQINNDIGAVYLNNGNYTEAEKYFNKALEINEKFPDALFNKAVAVFNKGNKYGAYKLFRQVGYIHQPPKYNDYMLVVVNAVADSIFKVRNIDLKKPVIKEDIRSKSYIFQIETAAFKVKADFITELDKEINLYEKQ